MCDLVVKFPFGNLGFKIKTFHVFPSLKHDVSFPLSSHTSMFGGEVLHFANKRIVRNTIGSKVIQGAFLQ